MATNPVRIVGEFPIKFSAINASTIGDNEIVAAVTGKKIRVLEIFFVCGAATTVRFESGAGGTALTGQMEFAANSGMGPGFSPYGKFETVSGESLSMELSAGNNIDGWLVYDEVS
jgi:hypothetical protein